MLLVQSFEQEKGYREMRGQAPAGDLERRLQAALEWGLADGRLNPLVMHVRQKGHHAKDVRAVRGEIASGDIGSGPDRPNGLKAPMARACD